MEIRHRISGRSSPSLQKELSAAGVEVPAEGLMTFESNESDAGWSKLSRIADSYDLLDIVSTRFTREEVCAAAWLEVLPDRHRGYPHPKHGYRAETYDLRDFCAVCGIGARQTRAFKFANEPTWGRDSVLQLNWVFDEYFVRPETWEVALRPLGVDRRPVHGPSGNELRHVCQIAVPQEQRVKIRLPREAPKTNCKACRRTKYELPTRGYFPRLASIPDGPIVRTEQWFGSGALAFQPVLVNKAVRESLEAVDARGVHFKPIAVG